MWTTNLKEIITCSEATDVWNSPLFKVNNSNLKELLK